MSKTFYIRETVEILVPGNIEAYTYRRNEESLGSLTLKSDGLWYVFDFCNALEFKFNSENKARKFIREKTPVLIETA